MATRRKVQPGQKASKALLRRALSALGGDDSDAAVVARAALAQLVDGLVLLDGEITHRAPELAKRLHAARAAIEDSGAVKQRQRREVIGDVELAMSIPADSSTERAVILVHLLKTRDPRFAALTHAPGALTELARRLGRKNASAVKLAADLAKRAGVESGNAIESYKQARKRSRRR